MIKLLIGGSPCTHWSIAQKNNRETKAEGIGWELFLNYLHAKEKFNPDFFLYENNKSAAQPIKDQISTELDVDLMYINSALVSAQNRQRFYAFNWNVPQPQDRGIMLCDIIESGVAFLEKSYALTTRCVGAIPEDTLKRHRHTMIAEPVRIGTIESNTTTRHDSKPFRVYSPYGKSVCLQGEAGGAGAKTGLYAVPINPSQSGKSRCLTAGYANKGVQHILESNFSDDPHKQTWDCVAEQTHGDVTQEKQTGKRIYTVENGQITIKGVQYPIALADGEYIIRKLTPIECERLQTLPDGYTAAVSNAQRYKGLGNGWTADVIVHILWGALRNIPRNEEILVLSMYDGIGTGRYCLEKMGFTNVKYFAYEIDKYAMTVANSNFSDIIQCGDAFDLRRNNWKIGG